MHYYKPILIKSKTLPPSKYQDQFGGLPWGFPVEKWPVCEYCHTPLSFLAQLKHDENHLPLGKEGRILYLFHCDTQEKGCPSYEAESGANSVIILDPEELTHGPVSNHPESLSILPCATVDKWEQCKEPSSSHPSEPFDYHSWLAFDDLTYIDSIEPLTRLGGTPDWLQIPEPYSSPYYFAGQIYHQLEISQVETFQVKETEHFRSLQLSALESEKTPEKLPFAHFGDNGMGYLFVHPDPDQPTGYFLWQSR